LTSQDDGQQFGLPVRLIATDEVNTKLSGAAIRDVKCRDGTLDLTLEFDVGYTVELSVDSSSYEAWTITGPVGPLIAVGGGDLAVVNNVTKPWRTNPLQPSGGSTVWIFSDLTCRHWLNCVVELNRSAKEIARTLCAMSTGSRLARF